MPSNIEAEISIPDVIHHPGGNKATIAIEVLARLHNSGEDSYVVGSSDPADVHNWHVLNENHREIMRPKAGAAGKGQKGVHPHASELVPAGHSHNCPATLTLDAKKLKPGKRYTLRYVYHGYAAEADFTVVAAKAAYKAPAKAPARKRAAPRKKAASKPAARKSASKSTSKSTRKAATKKK